jgi:hypothetical protein
MLSNNKNKHTKGATYQHAVMVATKSEIKAPPVLATEVICSEASGSNFGTASGSELRGVWL